MKQTSLSTLVKKQKLDLEKNGKKYLATMQEIAKQMEINREKTRALIKKLKARREQQKNKTN